MRKPLSITVLLLLALASRRSLLAQDSGEYRIGPRDVLDIKVIQIPDLNVERRASDDGKIDLPLIGEFPVLGLTADDVRDRLEAMLTARYVNRADVSVTIKEFANKPISILGAVGHSGVLGGGRWTLIQAITAAGGLTDAAGKKLKVFRRADSGLSDTLTISLDDLYRSSDPRWNIAIYPGDTVNVSGKTSVTIYLLGEVKSNGPVTVDGDEPISLLKIIARAGGLTVRASHTIRIKRKKADGKVIELRADYGRILSGKDPDMILEPDDIVLVKESFF